MRPKFPLDQLYQALGIELHDLERFCTVTRAARGTSAEARYRGGLTASMADKLAITAGLHPAEVWPEWLA